jgi:hypothetical protein
MFGNKQIKALQNQLNGLTSTLTLRDQIGGILGLSHGGERSTYDIYGYPAQYYFRDGYRYARREGVANRVAFGVPASCWRGGFIVKEGTPDEESDSILDDEINKLNLKQLFSRFERADVLNRMGAFSVLFVGVPDGLDFDQPIGSVSGDGFNSIYFRPFAYDGIEISKWNTDENSERYGMPELYQLEVMGRGDNEKSQQTQTIVAHYTRVIHLAENLLDNDVEGIPALEPIFNRILDIDKATGGAAEAYFRNARGKIAFEVDPEFSSSLMNDSAAKESFDKAGKAFTNNWQDQIVAVGSKINAITTPHQSPIDTVKVALWEISGNTGIPLRVLTGEGAGQLAGSEDRLAYNALICDRQSHVCAVWVRSLLDILSMANMIDLPQNYYVEFPLDEPSTAMDKALLNKTNAESLNLLATAKSSLAGDALKLDEIMADFGWEEWLDPDVEIDVAPEIGEEMNPAPFGDMPDGEE